MPALAAPAMSPLAATGAFGTVIIAVVLVTAVIAALSYIGAGRLYRQVGRGAFSLDVPDRPPAPPTGSPQARAEQEEDLRQLIQAKSDRREARGETPLDVEAEVRALLEPERPAVDEELLAEVRQLVEASNERRIRQGQPPLDVEEETRRQLRDLGYE